MIIVEWTDRTDFEMAKNAAVDRLIRNAGLQKAPESLSVPGSRVYLNRGVRACPVRDPIALEALARMNGRHRNALPRNETVYEHFSELIRAAVTDGSGCVD